MEDSQEKQTGTGKEQEGARPENIHTGVVKAGARTYYFDVKRGRNMENYLTITERKRKTGKDGRPTSLKSTIFLYPEDVSKFVNCLTESLEIGGLSDGDSVAAPSPETGSTVVAAGGQNEAGKKFTDISFDDLESG